MFKNKKGAALLLLPIVFIMIVFVLYPVLKTFTFSLQNYHLTKPHATEYIGLKNYSRILKDPNFKIAFKNSFFISIIVISFSFIVSICNGLLLNKKTKITPLLTAIAIIPWALPPLVNGIIWRFIFHPGYGLANKVLMKLNILEKPFSWTSNPTSVVMITAIVVSWRVIPFCSMIVLSNLQSIPEDLYEALRIDGGTKSQGFFKITLPLLKPSFGIILIQTTMAAINVFDELVTLSGFNLRTQTLLMYNYLNTFSFLNFGYGSAISYFIMLISGVVGFFYIRRMRGEMVE